MASRRIENVWDYPRPPKLEPVADHIEIIFDGIKIADTRSALRICETSHPPTYYIPKKDIQMQYISAGDQHATFCEWKGEASYYTISTPRKVAKNAAWTYEHPTPSYQSLAGHLAFYPSKMDGCFVAGERVTPQPGDFYGVDYIVDKWGRKGRQGAVISVNQEEAESFSVSDLAGFLKGGPGTAGW